MTSIPLWRYAKNTIASTHHQAFWHALDDALTPEQKARIAPGGDLRGIWEAHAQEAEPAPAPAERCLVVPYDFQGDNAGGRGYRECATSSCGMVAMFWGKIADVAANYVRRGSMIAVSGQLENETWTDKGSGEERSKIVLNVKDLTLLDSKKDSDASGFVRSAPDDDDDIPF